MNISSKILLGFVFLAAVVFMYMAARALKTHEYWRDQAKSAETDIERTAESIRTQQYGEVQILDDQIEVVTEGLRQRSITHHALVTRRGRVWEDVRPSAQPDPNTGLPRPAVDAATGVITVVANPVTVRPPILPGETVEDVLVPQTIAAGQMVYLFDQADRDQGGRFLGIFRVMGDRDGEQALAPQSDNNGYVLANLSPVLADTPSRQAARRDLVQRLSTATQGQNVELMMYDTLPRDRPGLFAGGGESLLPDTLQARYLDPDREIKDFHSLLVMINAEEARLDNAVDVRQTDLANYQAAVAKQQAILQQRRDEAAVLDQQVSAVEGEVSAVEQILQQVSQEVQQTEAAIDATFDQNRKLVDRLAQLQQEALDRAAQGGPEQTPESEDAEPRTTALEPALQVE